MDPQKLMHFAIEAAERGIAQGQTPFGCAIARGDELIVACHNVVWLTTDITAHAEITALRAACSATGQVLLEGYQVATTCEPCPMCTSALHWARVATVYFGATIADAAEAGFNELTVDASTLLTQGGSRVELVANVRREECQQLFANWKAGDAAAY